jgi:hypothetical protein
LMDASNLSDLLGLRVLGASTVQLVSEMLPRVRRAHLERHLAAGPPGIPRNWDPLMDAAAASVGRTVLNSREPEVCGARSAAVRVAMGLGASREEVGESLGVSARSVRRYAVSETRPDLERAVLGQLGLREQLRDFCPDFGVGVARSGQVRHHPPTSGRVSTLERPETARSGRVRRHPPASVRVSALERPEVAK